jgi:hypothetical protein
MCGIFGIVADSSKVSKDTVRGALSSLFLLSETRGKESAGITLVLPDEIVVQKSATRPKHFIGTQAYRQLIDEAMDRSKATGAPYVAFGHSRLVTNGSQTVHSNNQPVISGGIAGVHNGIIVNDGELTRTVPGIERRAAVDTEVFLQLVRLGLKAGQSLDDALRAAFGKVVGTVSTALAFEDHDVLALGTNNGSLYVASSPETGVLAFASERYILESFIARGGLPWQLPADGVRNVAADECILIDLRDGSTRSFHVGGNGEPVGDIPLRTRTIREAAAASDARQRGFDSAPAVNHADLSRFDIDVGPIRALRRCTRCILPETIPFIAFDASGVCNFCADYVPMKYRGRAALEADAEKLRRQRKGDGPDALFTLSGGRDSSYGLHYAVRELGLKPVAYTYDWGMITDLARRNQARMCGALKVEHILVSADIAKKRENIRRNVSAWLKKPSLGMIPLFMAGDKQYFYFANDLGKKLGLETTILASNPLEKTHFKAGFCGVPPTAGHRPSKAAQAKMAAFYAGQFLRNPAYINPSLIDTVGAFGSYYMISHQYLRLFDYVPWEEDVINSTLLQEYDWETATDTKSTWRIGDGTAAFYNYIYYRVAGFSENDTFRSNQIREGAMTRARALELAETENRPRFESIAWYCGVIGLDPVAVLDVISRIPTLYPTR